jgi:hypothetical protein
MHATINYIHCNRIANGGVAVPAQICALQQKHSGGAYIDEGNARLTIDGDRCQCEHRELNRSCGPRCNCPKEVRATATLCTTVVRCQACTAVELVLHACYGSLCSNAPFQFVLLRCAFV